MYIAATNRVVSVVLVVERKEEGKEQAVQCLVYYLSEVLSQSKQNYPHYQKVTYGVYMAAKKLKHYFQEHHIKVVATAPSRKSSAARTPMAGSPSGPWSWRLTPSCTRQEPPSSHRS